MQIEQYKCMVKKSNTDHLLDSANEIFVNFITSDTCTLVPAGLFATKIITSTTLCIKKKKNKNCYCFA